MSRVVVTGLGLVSCLGNDPGTVENALRHGSSGLRASPDYLREGLRSRVWGLPDLESEPPIDRKLRRFMGNVAVYAHHAMRKALDDARLSSGEISDPRTGIIMGSGSGSLSSYLAGMNALRLKGPNKMPPYIVPQTMGNSVSACLSTAYGIRGYSYGITAACATAAHCIGHAMDLILAGKQDVVLAGGAEEADWTSAAPFDAMGVLSTGFNDAPASASRPYDAARDGFVMAAGAGMLVLESLEHAQARGARIHAELAGYGSSSDGTDMIAPDPDGVARAMRSALDSAGMTRVDYVNTHATSTPRGDIAELQALGAVFGENIPLLSSTKGQTGHAIGAAGAHEAIYGLIMMNGGFIAPCANLSDRDPGTRAFPLVTERLDRRIGSFLSNSLGFGGTNACLIFRKWRA